MRVVPVIPALISPVPTSGIWFVAKEMLSSTLISIHNIHTLLTLVRRMRQAIIEQRFQEFSKAYLATYLSGNLIIIEAS